MADVAKVHGGPAVVEHNGVVICSAFGLRAHAALLTACGLVSLLCAGWNRPVWSLPAQVLLMRHGHKDPSATSYNLSPAGFQRAIALASVIPACFGAPTQITTYALDDETSKNARSYQTAVPLGVASGVNIRIDRTSLQDSRLSGERMLRDPSLQGGLLVLFWEHRQLPLLAAGLGWSGMPPITENDFDTIYRLTYQEDSSIPFVSRYSQAALLDGSQPCSALVPHAHP